MEAQYQPDTAESHTVVEEGPYTPHEMVSGRSPDLLPTPEPNPDEQEIQPDPDEQENQPDPDEQEIQPDPDEQEIQPDPEQEIQWPRPIQETGPHYPDELA